MSGMSRPTRIVKRGSPVEIQIPANWERIGASRELRRLCCRPAVFFRHITLFSLSLPQEKIQRAFKKVI
jgi:hypothetical protein